MFTSKIKPKSMWVEKGNLLQMAMKDQSYICRKSISPKGLSAIHPLQKLVLHRQCSI